MNESIGPVTLSGTGVKDLAFRSMTVSESMSTPFEYEVEVLSDKSDLDANTYLGHPMTVHLEIEGQEARHFNGLVAEFCLLGSVGENTLYRISLRPWLWFLQRVTNCRIFQDQKIPDIVCEVFRKHGFSDVQLHLSGKYEPREYVVQYRESDYNFICRLLEDEGIYFFFSHLTEQHLLVLCDSRASHDTVPGFATLEFYPPDPNRRAVAPHVDHWQVSHRVESGAYALRDYDFRVPTGDLNGVVVDPAPHGLAEFEVFDYPGGYDDLDAGKVRAKRRLHELQASRAVAQGHANARGLCVGALFSLEKHPIALQNRQYLVQAMQGVVRTHALESAYAEGSDDGEVFQCRFTCSDVELPYRPARKTPRPVVQGAQTAVVVGKEGHEIWTDEHGRVKLKFHWDRVPARNETSSCWVRVAQVWAGASFGAMFIPRMGQEVLVEFLEGDPDRPIVTGRVYNFDNMPPYELDKNKTQSGIKSRSTLKGELDNFNEIRFEDKKGAEELFIQAEKTQTTKVKGSQSISVDGSRSVSVGGDQSTTVTKNETQTYKAKRKMDVTGTNDDTITGAHTGTYKANRTLSVTGDDALTVAKGRTTTVTAAYNITATGQYQVTNGANIILLAGTGAGMTNGQCSIKFDGANATLKAPGKLQLTADGEISLACGAASVVLKSDGSIEISGAQKVNLGSGSSAVAVEPTGVSVSGTKVSSAAVGMHEISGALIKIN